jgi:Methylpurine-DNA glycosylase (MPG)/Helix-turn-helix domain of resolvase
VTHVFGRGLPRTKRKAMDFDPHKTLGPNFFKRDARRVARDLIGSYLVCRKAGTVLMNKITETEAYVGPHDLACHASRGRTERTQAMFGAPGTFYVYLVYGLHCRARHLDESLVGRTVVAENDRKAGHAVAADDADFDIRRERQVDGINKAKNRGVKFGRKLKLTPDRIAHINKCRKAGTTVPDIMRQTKLSKASVYRALGR